MRIWISRMIAVLFMLSVLAAPQSTVWGQDMANQADSPPAATPVHSDVGDDTATPTEEAEIGNGSESPEDSAGTPATEDAAGPAKADPAPTDGESDVSPLAELNTNYGFTAPAWDPNTQTFTVTMIFLPGFTAEVGDTIDVLYSSDSLSLNSGLVMAGGLPITATANDANETLTLTFTSAYANATSDMVTVPIALTGEVNFPACRPGTGYVNEAEIIFDYNAPHYYPAYLYVPGPTCEPSAVPAVDSVQYMPEIGAIVFGIDVPDAAVAPGSVITITYPQDKFQIDTASTDLFYTLDEFGTGIPVATAVASDGVITITFLDFDVPEESRVYLTGWMSASLSTEACDPDAGSYIIEIGRLFFVASPGGTFTSYIDDILCNAASPSKSGELSADGTQVIWTIDTGDLIGGGVLQDGILLTGTLFDCSTLVVAPAEGTTYEVDCDEENGYSFTVWLSSDDVARATVTITGNLDPELPFDSYVNCAVVTNRVLTMQAEAASTSAGHGGSVCAEVFPASGGDFITNTPDRETVYPGETLTYTVNGYSTTQLWWSVELNDVLPAGFEVTSVNCTIEPAALAIGDCVIQDDNTITIGATQTNPELAEFTLANFTVEITGTVTAEPGTELVSEACWKRSLEAPGLPPFIAFFGGIGGTVCASTSTMVLQPVEPVTPTPTEPAIPTPTPTEPAIPSPTPTEPTTPAPTTVPGETPTPDPTTLPVETQTPDPTTVPVNPVTPEPTIPATPGVTPTATADADPAPTSAVTGLPETGNGAGAGHGITMLLAALAASVLVAGAFGIRSRAERN